LGKKKYRKKTLIQHHSYTTSRSTHAELCAWCVTNMGAPFAYKMSLIYPQMKVLLLDNVILAHIQIFHLLWKELLQWQRYMTCQRYMRPCCGSILNTSFQGWKALRDLTLPTYASRTGTACRL
jgi:hypothetical protein